MYNVFLTGRCNLHCAYCFAEPWMDREPQPHPTAGSMSLHTFMHVLDFLTASRISTVSLMGGEPTLHPQFFEFIRVALEQDFFISIKSNAAWNDKVLRGIQALPVEGVHFLLNINPPSSTGLPAWQRIRAGALALAGRDMDYQLNIDRPDFEYRHILDLASEARPGRINWSLAGLVKGNEPAVPGNPKSVGSLYAKRIIDFTTAAGEMDIPTLGVHGSSPCMFSTAEYEQLLTSGGSLQATCQPVFDFMPDGSVLYCFSMGEAFGRKMLDAYEDLQALQQVFLEQLAYLRSDTYPLAECIDCPHAAADACHGGCLARNLKGAPPAIPSVERFANRIPLLSAGIRRELASCFAAALPPATGITLVGRDGQPYEIDTVMIDFLRIVDGQKTMRALFQQAFAGFPDNPVVWEFFQLTITNLLKGGALTLKPYRQPQQNDFAHAAMTPQ